MFANISLFGQTDYEATLFDHVQTFIICCTNSHLKLKFDKKNLPKGSDIDQFSVYMHRLAKRVHPTHPSFQEVPPFIIFPFLCKSGLIQLTLHFQTLRYRQRWALSPDKLVRIVETLYTLHGEVLNLTISCQLVSSARHPVCIPIPKNSIPVEVTVAMYTEI